MDEEITNAVENLFGKNVKIVDCEKTYIEQQEEVLLINGVPVKLDSIPPDDVHAIKNALLDGQMPSVDHLNQLLFKAGLAQQPIEVETSLSVKSTLTTTEEILVSRNGHTLDERTTTTKEDFNHESNQKEIWHPYATSRGPEKLCGKLKKIKLESCSDSTTDSLSDAQIGLQQAWSNATATSTSLLSSSSAITDSDKASKSTLSVIGSNVSSCDSGQDNVFHSVSLTSQLSQALKGYQNDSLICDTLSTADEMEECDNDKSISLKAKLNALIKESLYQKNDELAQKAQITYLICMRLFLKPQEALRQISKNILSDTANDPKSILTLLALWVELCPDDFRNEYFMQEVDDLASKVMEINQEYEKKVTELKENIKKYLQELDAKRQLSQDYLSLKSTELVERQSSLKSLKEYARTVYRSNNMIFPYNCPEDLAQQLFIIEYAHMMQINSTDLVRILEIDEIVRYITTDDRYDISFIESYAKLNIVNYLKWSDRLSQLIATEILKLKKNNRKQSIEFWLHTALACLHMNNCNSFDAIIKGLELPAIKRLDKTWSKKQFEKLSEFQSKSQLPLSKLNTDNDNELNLMIPNFKLFLKDLYSFFHKNGLKHTTNTLDDYTKFSQEIAQFVKNQQIILSYKAQPKILSYLLKYDMSGEDELYRLSFICETPKNEEEKQKQKSLKDKKKS